MGQIEAEVGKFLGMMNEIYGVLGLEYEMALSTRPEGACAVHAGAPARSDASYAPEERKPDGSAVAGPPGRGGNGEMYLSGSKLLPELLPVLDSGG